MKNNNQNRKCVTNKKKSHNSKNTTNIDNNNKNKTRDELIQESILVKNSELYIKEFNDIYKNELRSNDYNIIQVGLEKLVQKNYMNQLIYVSENGDLKSYNTCQCISKYRVLPLIIGFIYRYNNQIDVIIPALSLLSSYTNHHRKQSRLSLPIDTAITVIDATILSMRTHCTHMLVQITTCSIIYNILTYYSNVNTILTIYRSVKDMNILHDIVYAMDKHPDSEDLQLISCDILYFYYNRMNNFILGDDRKVMKDTCLGVLGKAICHESSHVRKVAAIVMNMFCNGILLKDYLD